MQQHVEILGRTGEGDAMRERVGLDHHSADQGPLGGREHAGDFEDVGPRVAPTVGRRRDQHVSLAGHSLRIIRVKARRPAARWRGSRESARSSATVATLAIRLL